MFGTRSCRLSVGRWVGQLWRIGNRFGSREMSQIKKERKKRKIVSCQFDVISCRLDVISCRLDVISRRKVLIRRKVRYEIELGHKHFLKIFFEIMFFGLFFFSWLIYIFFLQIFEVQDYFTPDIEIFKKMFFWNYVIWTFQKILSWLSYTFF